MVRMLFFLLGFGLMVVGCTYFVIYLNLFTVGFTFKEYLYFTFSKAECLFALIGFVMMTASIFWKGEEKIDLHL